MNRRAPHWIVLPLLAALPLSSCLRDGAEESTAPPLVPPEESPARAELTLRVLDHAGAPIASGYVLYGADSHLGDAVLFAEGRAILPADALPLVVVVRAPGCREVVLTGVSDDRDVVLQPGIPLELRLPLDTAAPAVWELRAVWPEDRLDEHFPRHGSPLFAVFDEAGVARLVAPRAGLLPFAIEARRIDGGSPEARRILLPLEDRILEVSALPERRVIELQLNGDALAEQLDG